MYLSKKEFYNWMESIAPHWLAESYDNVGMLVDSDISQYRRILFALDLSPEVAQEAADIGAELIVTHHPVMFKAIKHFGCHSREERSIRILIQHNIAMFATHTNFDSARRGVNAHLCNLFSLQDVHSIEPKDNGLMKITVFVPKEYVASVMEAMCGAEAGKYGKYCDCTFRISGTGTFMPLEGADPFIGTHNIRESVVEERLECVVLKENVQEVIQAMLQAHPYEEVAYDLVNSYAGIRNDPQLGLTWIGRLQQEMEISAFCEKVKQVLDVDHVRATGDLRRNVRNVAVSSGAGAESWQTAQKAGAHVLITGECKHNIALDADSSGFTIIEAGHYETEKPAMNALIQGLQERLDHVEYKTELFLSEREKPPFRFL